MQSGASFCHRHVSGSNVLERSVHASQQDNKWEFFESGQALEEEDLQLYKARNKRARLNEERMSQLLARLGASPWSEQFYALSKPCFVIRRTTSPSAIITRRREDVLKPG
jgi:hypothetical protein